MITKQITSDEGIKGISIEIDGRGADFYQDGTYYAWDDNGAFNRCEATNQLTPYVSRNALQEAINTAEKELGVTFAVSSIGIDVDNESDIDPLSKITTTTMEITTLNRIAHHIHKKLKCVEKRSIEEMLVAITDAASDAKSEREAAYLIATEVFCLTDTEEEDRRKINDILSEYEGEWWPERIDE